MSRTVTSAPLLSVVTVLRDGEVDTLEAFLARVRAWGGERLAEVCVYDTSAAGMSHDLSDRLGVAARRGFWDRELGRARNEAMSVATGDWVLILDLDETPCGDVAGLMRVLRTCDDDVLVTEVRGAEGSARFGRLLRRTATTYIGSESEITASAFTATRRIGWVPDAAFGIEREERTEQPQAPRRLQRLLEELDASATGDDSRRVRALTAVASECRAVGRPGRAGEHFAQIAERAGNTDDVVAGLEHYADLLTSQAAFELADGVLRRLESGSNPVFAAWLRVHWHLARGEAAVALEALRTQEPPTPTLGAPLPDDVVVRLRHRLAQALGANDDLLSSLLALMMVGEEIEGNGKLLLRLWGRRSAQDLADILADAGAGPREAIIAELERTSTSGAHVARLLRAGIRTYRTAAVIIAKDEARCIERCVASLVAWVDEVVVADTGSTDDTAQRAERAGARVVQVPWVGDFAAARNAALEAASADWHVVVDADEFVDGGGAELTELRHLSPEHVLAVHVVSTFEIDGTLQREVENQSRIIPGRVRYRGAIHEAPAHDLPVTVVNVTIRHDGYEPAQLEKKLPQRESILRKSLSERGGDYYFHYQLGRNLETQRRHAEAIQEYSQVDSNAVSHEGWHHIFVVQFAHSLTVAGRALDALVLLAENADRYADSPDYHFVCGNVLIDLAADHVDAVADLLPRAAEEFRMALRLGVTTKFTGHVPARAGELARRNLEVVLATASEIGIAIGEDGSQGKVGVSVNSTFAPLASGSLDVVMIVKNEEANLGRALESMNSLRPLLGRVCVYDTGSTDATIDIARQRGAYVVEGYWDNNYSRARNAAAAMSSAKWLFVVDADEAVAADADELAQVLGQAEANQQCVLFVEVTPDARHVGVGKEWMSPRIYRPDLLHYERPVHAELRQRDGEPIEGDWRIPSLVVRIDNFGVDEMRLRVSNRRSLSLTAAALENGGTDLDRQMALVDRGRARRAAGDLGGARADLSEAASMAVTTTYGQWAKQLLAGLLLEFGEWEELDSLLGDLKAHWPSDPYVEWLEARRFLALNEHRKAYQLCSGLPDLRDALGFPVPAEDVAALTLQAAIGMQDESAIMSATLRLSEARPGDLALRDRAARMREIVTRRS